MSAFRLAFIAFANTEYFLRIAKLPYATRGKNIRFFFNNMHICIYCAHI